MPNICHEQNKLKTLVMHIVSQLLYTMILFQRKYNNKIYIWCINWGNNYYLGREVGRENDRAWVILKATRNREEILTL